MKIDNFIFCRDKTNCVLFFTVLITSIIMAFGVFNYFYKDVLYSSGTNVLKIKTIEKIESGMVNSDFYYRISKYNHGKLISEYSELVPLTATFGYNISHLSDSNHTIPAASIETEINRKSSIYLLNHHSDLLIREAKNLKKFSESYAEIIATQDPDYIENSDKQVSEILKNIFGISFKVISTNFKNYYQEINISTIPNLNIKYYKKNNDFKILNKVENKWQPNIVEWKNTYGDVIHLQLLNEVKKMTLGKVIERILVNFSGTFVRVSNYNKEDESTFYLTYKNGENKLKGYYIDESRGEIYLLVLYTSHVNRILKDLNNYLKVAMGIKFTSNTRQNRFSLMQKEVEAKKELFCSDDFLSKVEVYNNLYDDFNKYGLTKYYFLKKLDPYTICYKKSNNKWLSFYETFKKQFDSYPNIESNKLFNKLFYKMNKLERIFDEEQENVRNREGFIKSIMGMPYNYIEIKASEKVKNKYLRKSL